MTEKQRFLRFSWVWLLVFVSFAIPEVFSHANYNQWITPSTVKKMSIFTLLSVLCAVAMATWPGRIVTAVLWWAQQSQVMHHEFFQRYYNGGDIGLFFVETRDIFTGMAGMWRMSLVPFALGIGSLCLLVIAARVAHHTSRARIAGILAMLLVLANGVYVANRSLWKVEPDFKQLAIHNGLNAMVTYGVRILPAANVQEVAYQPYTIVDQHPEFIPNIILWVGESVNPRHLSLLGYKRDTTPRLQALLEANHGQAKIIYSGGVTTRVATPMLFAVNREPLHLARYRTRVGHLISTAKDRGYRTLLASTQTLDFLSPLAVMADYDSFVDRSVKRDLADVVFPEYLKQLPLDDSPYFAIFNIRVPHLPYAEHVSQQKAKFSAQRQGDRILDTINEYDDALRAMDELAVKSLNVMLMRDKRPTLILMTSDHGENMGENGLFGHNTLRLDTAEVPLLLVAAHWPEGMAVPDIQCVGNHYQLGVFLLQQMGFQLTNPNQEGQRFYVNGNDIYGTNGSIEYTLPECPAPG